VEVPRDKLDVRDDPAVISPPIVTQPLYACATAVNVTGYLSGAKLDLEVDGVIVVAGFGAGSPFPNGALLPLPAALVANQVVRARQLTAAATSDWSSAATVRDHTADYPAGPPRPEIGPLPLFDCGIRTGVGNLLVGCDLRLTADGNPIGAVAGANNPQGVNVSPSFATNQHVRAWAELCHDPSPPSVEEVVQPAPGSLPALGFDPIYEGGTDLVVTNLADGAKFSVSRNAAPIGTFGCWGGSFRLGINPPFAIGDTFSATQELCAGNGSSPPGSGTTLPCSALPAPQVAPVADGATQVVLTSFVAGSELRIFVNGVKTGDGSGPVVTLTAPVPHAATIDVWQILGTCQGRTVQETKALCMAPPVAGDPSALDLFPVGTHEFDSGQTTIDGFTYDIRGSIYYPADDDGVDQPFNTRLAALGRVPVVVCVHGAHSSQTPSYQGYDYFQAALARMGFVAMSVDERQTDLGPDWSGWTQNIVRRAELGLAAIGAVQALDANGPILQGRIDFGRTGLMGHSRGGDAVLAMAERNALAGVAIRAVLSLAPVNSGANGGRPRGFAFMTFLPAADGDVVDNNGAEFYDGAEAAPIKTQLYIDFANHNFFNRQWTNDDTGGGLPTMARGEHERILLAYGSALFRFALRGDATLGYLDHSWLPAGVQNQNVHLGVEVTDPRTVDDYEGHPITVDSEAQATAPSGGLVAKDFAFTQGGGAFNGSFFGATIGNVSVAQDGPGDFREPLREPADLSASEVRVRAAEVYVEPSIPSNPTGFRVGVEDRAGTVAWIDVDDVGGLTRPFGRRAFDLGQSYATDKTKTMLSTFRVPGHCFKEAVPKLELTAIVALRLELDRLDRRPLAFDDLEIVKV
jgi:dienelactone hydrolase